MIDVDRPIVIVGTGRCGSTMLHRILALHRSLGWLSTFNEVFPTQLWLSVFSNLYRTSLPVNVRHWPAFPKPFEAYKFWEHYLPAFSRREKPQTRADVPAAAIGPVRDAVEELLGYQNRERLLIKVTGWSRIAYFDRIFPQARFIFLNRELRSVLSSWAQAGWLDVTSSIDSEEWQWGEVPALYRRLWSELGGGPVLSAAVKIQLDLDDIRSNVAQFPDRCREIQYENLVSDPHECLRTITDFCGLDWYTGFEQRLAAMKFYDAANKWKRYLTEEQANRVVEFFARARQSVSA